MPSACRINAGVWRFHPKTHRFEVFAEGTSNPWGLDFNDYGHAFTTACVIEHLYHVVLGARYKRQAGRHFNPNVYDDIKTIADHVHWVGSRGPHAGNSRSGSAGGGHAHAGAMIYLGGDGWPKEYRDTIFMNNIHGFRTNTDRLQRKGSGYAATHGPDFLLANDAWSQMINFRYGPDGSVHVIDWYDKNQCHSTNPDLHQKTLGRIFKISHETDRWSRRRSEEAAVGSARRSAAPPQRLVRAARAPDPAGARARSGRARAAVSGSCASRPIRRASCARSGRCTSPADSREDDLLALAGAESEYVRSWAVTLLADEQRAVGGRAPRASPAWRARIRRRSCGSRSRARCSASRSRSAWDVLTGLLGHDEDAADQNLPLMIWYAAEPVVELDMARALGLSLESKLPNLFPFTVRRIAAIGTQDALRVLTDRLGRTQTASLQKELLNGICRSSTGS